MRNEIVFRIVGQDVLPDEVTQALGLKPDEAFKKGDSFYLKPERKHSNGLWLLKSKVNESDAVEKHIVELLKCLKGKKESVKTYSYKDGVDVELFCGLFIDNEDEIWDGVKLDSNILIEIGSFGIDLNIQVYDDID